MSQDSVSTQRLSRERKQPSLIRQSNISEDDFNLSYESQTTNNNHNGLSPSFTSGLSPVSPVIIEEEDEDEDETFPKVTEELFQMLSYSRPSQKSLSDTIEILGSTFKKDRKSLPQRQQEAKKDYKVALEKLHSVTNTFQQCNKKLNGHFVYGNVPFHIINFERLYKDYEIQTKMISKLSNIIGRNEIELCIYKLIEALLLDIRIKKVSLNMIKDDFLEARKLLAAKGIPFPLTKSKKAIETLHRFQNTRKDTSQLDFRYTQFEDTAEEDGFLLDPNVLPLEHLLGPKLSHAGLLGLDFNKIRLEISESKLNKLRNFIKRSLSEMVDIIQTELEWPWNRDQTNYGIKQLISMLMMLIGLFIFAQTVFGFGCM